MHKAIMTIELTATGPRSHGRISFAEMPRIGEWIEVEEGGLNIMYAVVMVTHSSKGVGTDIYIKRFADIAAAVKSLRAQ